MNTSRNQRGGALIAILVLVMLCGAIAAYVVVPALSHHRATEAYVQRLRAFQMAEAGIECGIAEIRGGGGLMPAADIATTDVPGAGSYSVVFTSGLSNLVDDDGDGVVDESDEDEFLVVTAIGTSGDARRAIRVLTRRSTDLPVITAALTLNVASPIIDVNGNRFIVDGRDHASDGTLDPFSPALYALATPAPIADVTSQLSPQVIDQFLGLTASPSIGQTALFDMTPLIANASAVATITVEPGSHANAAWGESLAGGAEVVVCNGDLHVSGNTAGAGTLIVNGDLVITGTFTWTGLVLVRGTLRMSGGGSGKMIIGAVMIGEEMQSIDTDLTLSGTIDLVYSATAVDLATIGTSTTTVVSWHEVAVP